MRRREDGFTLVEALVALALLGVASLLVVQGLSASRGAARRLDARRDGVAAVAGAEDRLRQALQGMTVNAHFETARPYVELEGAADHLDFVGPGGSAAGPRRLSLRLDEAGELELSPADAGADAPGEVLLRNVAGLDLAYWGPGDAGGPRAWRDAWSHAPSPPERVRVRLSFAPGDRRVWPELIVRPAAEVDADCVVDPDTSLCRGRA